MRPRERRESGEQDLFRSRLDQVINMNHALVKLARTIDWGFLEEKFGAVYKDGAGQPAIASIVGGTVRPSVLAVLRLIASSNFVDCMTGRSAGFSPLRMRPRGNARFEKILT
jgi:hypothetical protein